MSAGHVKIIVAAALLIGLGAFVYYKRPQLKKGNACTNGRQPDGPGGLCICPSGYRYSDELQECVRSGGSVTFESVDQTVGGLDRTGVTPYGDEGILIDNTPVTSPSQV